MTKLKELHSKIDTLSPKEINDLDILIALLKSSRSKDVRLQQKWAGGLKEFRDTYTSVELQKQSLEWRKD